jgi:hypothetical protein
MEVEGYWYRLVAWSCCCQISHGFISHSIPSCIVFILLRWNATSKAHIGVLLVDLDYLLQDVFRRVNNLEDVGDFILITTWRRGLNVSMPSIATTWIWTRITLLLGRSIASTHLGLEFGGSSGEVLLLWQLSSACHYLCSVPVL